MNDELEYIKDSFTKVGDDTNLEVNNLNVACITSKNNKFNLDSEGNLTVKSITATSGLISNEAILNYIYPIGSIYMSVNDTNPTTMFGGSWERIKDRFLLASGDLYQNKTVGGESTHTLTAYEMPSHTHTITASGAHSHTANFLEVRSKIVGQASNNVARPNTSSYDSTGTINTSYGEHTHPITSTGSGQAHNNMPPYLAVYIWKRTA